MFIDLDFFDVFYAITVAMGFGVAFYFANRHANKELIKLIEEETGIVIKRINDIDNDLADFRDSIDEIDEFECPVCGENKKKD